MDYLKLGITQHPPRLVIFYKADEKTRKKIIPLRKFNKLSNCDIEADAIIQEYNIQIPKIRIKKLLRLIQVLNETNKEEALKKIQNELDHESDGILMLGLLKTQENELKTLFTNERDLTKDDNSENNSSTEDVIDLPEENDSFWGQN